MRLIPFLFLVGLFLLFAGCGKEKSFEVPAPGQGSLHSEASGDCLPKTVGGAFIAGTALSDSNYLEVEIDVAKTGSYSIATDTVNGYSFKGMGNFAATGINKIRLIGSGKPIAAGDDPFTIIYDTTACRVHVTVLPAGSSAAPAAFTLQGSGDTCLIAAVSGTYVQNAALTSSNTVAIKVNATTAGTYTITTNAVTGFLFSGTGTISTPGSQTITLTASGTPTTAGPTVFTISAGGTTCTFTVDVTASGTPPPVSNNGDHFPLTTNSFWTYSDVSNAPGDSTIVTNHGPVQVAGNTYNFFEHTDPSGQPSDTVYYRRAGDDYYAYLPVDTYSSLVFFDTAQKGEVLFLKENAKTGDTWNSAEYSGTYSGQAVKLQYVFTVTDANATVTRNGITYTNVYVVKAKPQASIGGPYAPTGEEVEWDYAKGIGLVYGKAIAGGSIDHETILLHYQIF